MLSIPYEGEALDLLIILPHESSNLEKVEMKIEEVGHDMAWVCNKLKVEPIVEVSIPKCKIESTLKLNEPLKKVGCSNMLDKQECDLSGMSINEDLVVSLVMQKTTVEFDHEGTEAASATAGLVPVVTSGIATSGPVPEFKCNRPYYFAIREGSSGLTLFSGRVKNPGTGNGGIGIGAGIGIT